MIISHKHKFIFLKTKKTAGTSIEIALSKICDQNDIVTTIKEDPLRIAEGGRPGRNIPQSWRNSLISARGLRTLLTRGRRPWLLHHHVRAPLIKEFVGPEVWRDYLKISIERNPWDRIISQYYFQLGIRKNSEKRPELKSISDFIQYYALKKPESITNWPIYTINNNIVADYMLFFENLNGSLNRLKEYLGIEIKLPEQRVKGNYRKCNLEYKKILSNRDVRLIAKVCHREIEAFGYKF